MGGWLFFCWIICVFIDYLFVGKLLFFSMDEWLFVGSLVFFQWSVGFGRIVCCWIIVFFVFVSLNVCLVGRLCFVSYMNGCLLDRWSFIDYLSFLLFVDYLFVFVSRANVFLLDHCFFSLSVCFVCRLLLFFSWMACVLLDHWFAHWFLLFHWWILWCFMDECFFLLLDQWLCHWLVVCV